MTGLAELLRTLLVERFTTTTQETTSDPDNPDNPKACAQRRAQLLQAVNDHEGRRR